MQFEWVLDCISRKTWIVFQEKLEIRPNKYSEFCVKSFSVVFTHLSISGGEKSGSKCSLRSRRLLRHFLIRFTL